MSAPKPKRIGFKKKEKAHPPLLIRVNQESLTCARAGKNGGSSTSTTMLPVSASALEALLVLTLDIEAFIPTLVVGAFNLHSTTWTLILSPGAGRLKSGRAQELLNAPGVATCRGMENQRDST